MSRLIILASLAALLSACNQRGPTSPSPGSSGTAARTHSLSGMVFERLEAGPVPVEGVAVQVADSANRATTGHDGSYIITGLPAVRSSVSVSKAGYVRDTRSVDITGDTQADIEIVRLARYVLSGIVSRASPTGESPFAALQIYCDGCGELGHTFVTTDVNGFYRFPWVYAGVHHLQLFTQEYRDPDERFVGIMVSEVIVTGDTQFNLRLVPR